ncbi:RNA-binding protein [Anaerostipes sp. 494a]|uniref:ribonuclease E/G n=1 Tax=unclassified Anaerostipes TaxID=2635253 RepID=UPI000950FA9C|nr:MULTISPECIES: ribonuclease E/G [unclassified Anaerostipes]MCI5624230.1 ribonuclease E/G [Anaerostipes sp.]MDY2726868.1 ribonuclease E/G [Anaerostipes faecalis]OLR58689.1 RNA-binding protein [Anaerostipes sp. 494a]
MSTEIIVTKIDYQIVSAWLENHKIVEFQCISSQEKSLVGNIYIGKVKNIVKNIRGAFVEFQKGELGYLPLRNDKLKIDDEILVQVKREATEEKRPMLSDRIELTGKYLVLTSDKTSIGVSNKIRKKETRQQLKIFTESLVTDDFGFILRTNAARVSKEAVLEEAAILAERYQEIIRKKQYRQPFVLLDTNQNMKDLILFGKDISQIDKIITDQTDIEDLFLNEEICVEILSEEAHDIERRYRLKHFLKEALSKKIWMKSGGFLYIEQTEAMAVIDVNSGKSIGKGNKADHVRKINMEAAKEAARQIRLRNLSGIIVIDFIDMESEYDKDTLLRVMQGYLNEDSKKAVAVDITKLGLMELTRKKERNPLLCQINIDKIEKL